MLSIVNCNCVVDASRPQHKLLKIATKIKD